MKPILFNTEMVQVILDRKKTVTRRVIKGLPQDAKRIGWDMDTGNDKSYGEAMFQSDCIMITKKCKYLIGDILYVRETWSTHYTAESNAELEYCYKADGIDLKAECLPGENNRWYPSIHMPKEAARIFLRVTDVRIERLQDITEEQARKEGIREYTKDGKLMKYAVSDTWWCNYCSRHKKEFGGTYWQEMPESIIKAFYYLWNSTIKEAELGQCGWDANPYVWVYEFEVISKAEAMKESEYKCQKKNS